MKLIITVCLVGFFLSLASSKGGATRRRIKRFVDVTGIEKGRHDYFKPSMEFCNKDTGEMKYLSPIPLGLVGVHRKKGESMEDSIRRTGQNKQSEDISIFHPKKQMLRFNKRYNKIRDLMFFQNDGEKLIFAFQENFTSDASVRGENWDDEYIFAMGQFQWSLDSIVMLGGVGHSIHGSWFPLEMELIHYRKSDGSLQKAWDKRGVLIVSILFQMSTHGSPPLTFLFKNLPYVAEPGSLKLLHGPVNFGGLFPSDVGWFEYMGSYTYSPCYENVRRIVLETPMDIDQAQIDKFKYLQYSDGTQMTNNYRPLQKINGRDITYNEEGYMFSTRSVLKRTEAKSHKHGYVGMKPHKHNPETGEKISSTADPSLIS